MAYVSSGGERCERAAGRTLFQLAGGMGVRVPSSCDASGSCHDCIVEVTRGMEALVPGTPAESFLRENYRLSCQAAIAGEGIDVEFAPLERRPRILTSFAAVDDDLDPIVTRHAGKVYYDGVSIDEDRGRICGL